MTACFGVRDIERFLLLKRLASWWPGQAICSQEHIHSLPSDLGRRTIGAAQAPKSRNAAIQKAADTSSSRIRKPGSSAADTLVSAARLTRTYIKLASQSAANGRPVRSEENT